MDVKAEKLPLQDKTNQAPSKGKAVSSPVLCQALLMLAVLRDLLTCVWPMHRRYEAPPRSLHLRRAWLRAVWLRARRSGQQPRFVSKSYSHVLHVLLCCWRTRTYTFGFIPNAQLKPVKSITKNKSRARPVAQLLAKAKAKAGMRPSNLASTAASGSAIKRTKKVRLAKVLAGRSGVPSRSTKQLTIPEVRGVSAQQASSCSCVLTSPISLMRQDVPLATSIRAAAQSHAADGSQGTEVGRDGSRQGSCEQLPCLTRALLCAQASPFKPLVLRVKEFDRTPSRFKRKPDPAPPARSHGLTSPKVRPALLPTTCELLACMLRQPLTHSRRSLPC